MKRRAVIMAGGAGTRLWPLSRQDRPKQLLPLLEGASLLRRSYERLRALLEPQEIFVITAGRHLGEVARQLPELPAENLIGEPCGRDTANAIGLAAALLHCRDPQTVMGVFTADHVIEPLERFAAAVRLGYEAAEANGDALVTFGIKPGWPHTGLGYIHRGQPMGPGLYAVRRFREKPDLPTATAYVDSGQYYWNSGMFVWRTETILAELHRHLPDSYLKLARIADRWGQPGGAELAGQLYPSLQKISIDFAVMEKARRVLVVEMDCRWLDVGSWAALASVFRPDEHGNIRALERAALVEARDNILVADGEHLIAAIGVSDLIVVHSADATLVCRRADAEKIKNLVSELQQAYGSRYL